MFQKRRSGNYDSDLRFLKLSCWMIFLLGFESGGFQLALLKIAREFVLTNTEMGGLVSVQFLAMMIMPVIFGTLADIVGKKKDTAVVFADIYSGLYSNDNDAVLYWDCIRDILHRFWI